jgi:hypothetical protein
MLEDGGDQEGGMDALLALGNAKRVLLAAVELNKLKTGNLPIHMMDWFTHEEDTKENKSTKWGEIFDGRNIVTGEPVAGTVATARQIWNVRNLSSLIAVCTDTHMYTR